MSAKTPSPPVFAIRLPDGGSARDGEGVIEYVTREIGRRTDWRGRQGGAGTGLVTLFGRLTELSFNRLNRLPEKHLLAFLNAAGIEPLAPRAAKLDLSFTPGPDVAGGFVRVPVGTQVATIKTEDRPEIVFETDRNLVVIVNTLSACVAIDALNSGDYTDRASGRTAGAFPAFAGQKERPRELYIGDGGLLDLSDPAVRKAAKISLGFKLHGPGDPAADGWTIQWRYWDGNAWKDLRKDGGAKIEDGTGNLSQSGKVVLRQLPQITKRAIGGVESRWILAAVHGGTARDHLPVISKIEIGRTASLPETRIRPRHAWSGIQAGTTFVPIDPSQEFLPFGHHPGRLDGFYLQADAALDKAGATLRMTVDLIGVPEDPQDDSELKDLKLEWNYSGQDGWSNLGSSTMSGSETDGLTDTTRALTATGDTGYIEFTVPDDAAQTKVNDLEGYWLRARIVAGSYDEPGGMQGQETGQKWVPPRVHAPLIKALKLTFRGYALPEVPATEVKDCRGGTDGDLRELGPALAKGTGVAPFSAPDEGPSLYLGLDKAFPANEWIQFLVDVRPPTRSDQGQGAVGWEYWNGRWQTLNVSDGSRDLSRRGYVGLFGPGDQRSRKAFGHDAYWLRLRRRLPPRAEAGPDRTVAASAEQGTARVTLDGSRSRTFAGTTPRRYHWDLRPTAKAGADTSVETDTEEATIVLDGSKSTAPPGRRIVAYRWREQETTQAKSTKGAVSPYLNGIHLNTIPAQNAQTLRDEVLGSSNGQAGQRFHLLRSPVLPGARIHVLEPDQPPEEELEALRAEIQRHYTNQTSPLRRGPAGEKGVWVPWVQVQDLLYSASSSRHFVLDPITGELRFGDGEHGKIPPVGRDNILASAYRTHDGAQGNVRASAVSVLRNPTGDLTAIKAVTNKEAAAGGSAGETLEGVERRGPQFLKHRNRAVTREDFETLAREASGQVAVARCLPTRDRLGLVRPGWVTVVVTPRGTSPRPSPSPTLLREVRRYLHARALTNLRSADHLHVKGPDYIQVSVTVTVVPGRPEDSDAVELAVLDRLQRFLHPLHGGPEGEGWALGRDVYRSEIYAELEAVTGLDHAADLRFTTSLQQRWLRVALERPLDLEIPAGSRVGTFDETTRLILAEDLHPAGGGEPGGAVSLQIGVYGFKTGDRVQVVSGDDATLVGGLRLGSFEGDTIKFTEPFVPPADWDRRDGLMREDGRVRMLITQDGVSLDKDHKVSGLRLRGPQPGDEIGLAPGGRDDPRLEFIPVTEVRACVEHAFIPEGHLAWSGSHDVRMRLE